MKKRTTLAATRTPVRSVLTRIGRRFLLAGRECVGFFDCQTMCVQSFAAESQGGSFVDEYELLLNGKGRWNVNLDQQPTESRRHD